MRGCGGGGGGRGGEHRGVHAARTLLMPLEPPSTTALDSADDEDMEGVDDYHVGSTEVHVPHPHPPRSAKRAQARNRRCHADEMDCALNRVNQKK